MTTSTEESVASLLKKHPFFSEGSVMLKRWPLPLRNMSLLLKGLSCSRDDHFHWGICHFNVEEISTFIWRVCHVEEMTTCTEESLTSMLKKYPLLLKDLSCWRDDHFRWGLRRVCHFSVKEISTFTDVSVMLKRWPLPLRNLSLHCWRNIHFYWRVCHVEERPLPLRNLSI